MNKPSRRTHESAFILSQNRENEQQTNRIVGLVALGLVASIVVTQLMLIFDYSYMIDTANISFFFPLSFVVVVCFFIAFKFRFDRPWIKYMLLTGILLMAAGQFMLYSLYCSYLMFVPVILSTRYFDRRFIRLVAISSTVLFAAGCAVNLIFCDSWLLLKNIQEFSVHVLWENPLHAFVFLIIPLSMTAVFLVIYLLRLTRAGHVLLNAGAENAYRMSAVDAELRMAADIQNSALPVGSFVTPEGQFSLEAVEHPAREVGGDFYDYYMLDDHTLAFLVADVSDKGVPAAMFMMSAKKALRCTAECCHSLKEAAAMAAKLICDGNDSEMFLTLWLGLLDTRSGVGKYVNAGHPFPLVRSADGSVRPLSNEPDTILGVFDNAVPAVHTFHLLKGDTLLLYTDGITDARNTAGQSFGEEGIISALGGATGGAKEAVDAVLTDVTAFAGESGQFDDMTLLALHCNTQSRFLSRTFDTSAGTAGTALVIDGVTRLLGEVRCPEATRRNVSIVTDEVCANIAEHAYNGAEGRMSVRALAGSNCLRLVFEDDGDAFDPLEHADPVFTDEPIMGGLGIFFVKQLTDRILYRRVGDRNELTVDMIWGM